MLKNTYKIIIRVVVNYLIILLVLCALIALIPDSREGSYLLRIANYTKIIFTLDFGFSSQYGFTIKELILNRAQSTLLLMLMSLFTLTLLTILLSLTLAKKPKSRIANVFELIINYFSSVPYLIYALLFLFMSFWVFKSVPVLSEFDRSDLLNKSLILLLPTMTLAIGDGIFFDCYMKMKNAIERLYQETWLRSAKAKGNNVTYHLLRGLVEPIATIISSKIAYLLSGSIIVEFIFTWQGIGLLLWETITYQGERDYPLLLATISTILIFVFVVSFIRDLISVYLNPHMNNSF